MGPQCLGQKRERDEECSGTPRMEEVSFTFIPPVCDTT